MSPRPVILAIDDEPKMLQLLTSLLKPEYAIHGASSGPEGLSKAEVLTPDLILLDLNMPQMSGLAVLKRLRANGSKPIPVIVITAYGGVRSAVQAIKLGAADYIQKPFEKERLKQTVRACLAGRKGIGELPSRHHIVGDSPQIRKVWQWVEQYGLTDLPILLCGETGTGKELFAKAIHEISKRREGPFVPVDVSTIPESLVESEIFGYEKGAFTGANRNKCGRLAWANGGVLFLDEVSNLSLSCQAKLLRVLQEEHYVPLGGKGVKTLDMRLVSATNSDLGEAIEQGRFREDLYYRINAVTIEVPPLREREGDMELLAHHFVEKYGRKYDKSPVEISDEAMEWLRSYEWPGNVRELEHTIARAVVLADRTILSQHLGSQHLGLPRSTDVSTVELERTTHPHPGSSPGSGDGREIVLHLNFRCALNGGIDLKRLKEKVAAEAERLLIAEVKNRLSLNQTELAGFLGIDPKTLRSKIRKRG